MMTEASPAARPSYSTELWTELHFTPPLRPFITHIHHTTPLPAQPSLNPYPIPIPILIPIPTPIHLKH